MAHRMMDLADLLEACGSLIQSFSRSDSSGMIEDILREDDLDMFFPNQRVFDKYQTTYIRLSHYTVKVCVKIDTLC